MSLANLIGGISAENRLLRPCQQDRPVLALLCGTPCKYGLWRSWREPVNSERLYKRSRPLLRLGSREATLCLFVAPRQRTPRRSARRRDWRDKTCVFVIGLRAASEPATGEELAIAIIEELGLVLGVAWRTLHDTAKASAPDTCPREE
jgi:hypothetical protein